jgi:hypothetical protein
LATRTAPPPAASPPPPRPPTPLAPPAEFGRLTRDTRNLRADVLARPRTLSVRADDPVAAALSLRTHMEPAGLMELTLILAEAAADALRERDTPKGSMSQNIPHSSGGQSGLPGAVAG